MSTDRYHIPALTRHPIWDRASVDALDDLTLVTWRHFSRPATPSRAADAMRRRLGWARWGGR